MFQETIDCGTIVCRQNIECGLKALAATGELQYCADLFGNKFFGDIYLIKFFGAFFCTYNQQPYIAFFSYIP